MARIGLFPFNKVFINHLVINIHPIAYGLEQMAVFRVDMQPAFEKAAADQQGLGQAAAIGEIDLRHAIDVADANTERDRGARFIASRRALDMRNPYHRPLDVHAAPVVAKHVKRHPVLPFALELLQVYRMERRSARSCVELGLHDDIAGRKTCALDPSSDRHCRRLRRMSRQERKDERQARERRPEQAAQRFQSACEAESSAMQFFSSAS